MARWSRAIAALPFRHGRVLDLGCAFGFTTLKLAGKGYQMVGVDNSARYIAQAKRRHPTGEYILCSAETLPLADASFDGILFLDVLEHVANEEAVISEIRRVLKPGGTLIIGVPHRGLLSKLDALNLYARLVCRFHHGLFPRKLPRRGSTGTIPKLNYVLSCSQHLQYSACSVPGWVWLNSSIYHC